MIETHKSDNLMLNQDKNNCGTEVGKIMMMAHIFMQIHFVIHRCMEIISD